MSGASIDGSAFRSAFDRFPALVEARSGHRFRSFDEGLAAIWENYKPRLRDHALGLLNSGDWSEGEAEVRGDGFRQFMRTVGLDHRHETVDSFKLLSV